MPKNESLKKNVRQKNTEQEVYTLHIGVAPEHHSHKTASLNAALSRATPTTVESNEPTPKEKHPEPAAHPHRHDENNTESEKKSPSSPSLFRKIWDKLEFVVVSAAVFGVIYVALNWAALYENALHYYDVWRGYESPLAELTENTPQVSERLESVNSDSLRGTNNDGIPPLGIEVYPPDMRIVIPRINKNVPVVGVRNENLINRRWEELEGDIQNALRGGVVHYPGTALPGENGNVVITGHSSYYAWDPGRFKDVFALLHDVREGDKVLVYFNQKKYLYEIQERKVVLPKDVDVLAPTNREQITLITCTPIGTNLKRLILIGKLVETSV